MTEKLSPRLDSFGLPSLLTLRDIWRYRSLATPPQSLSKYSDYGEAIILRKMGIGVRDQLMIVPGYTSIGIRMLDLDELAALLEKRGAEYLVTNVFGEERQSWLTRFVGLPYREFQGVKLRGIQRVGETAEPVCALVVCSPHPNGRTKLKIEAGWGDGAKRLETQYIIGSGLLRRWVNAEMELEGNNWNIIKIEGDSGFKHSDDVHSAIAPLASLGSKALDALQIEYNKAFNRQLRRRGTIAGLSTAAAILALFGHPPLELTQERLPAPTPSPSPTATAVATTDWEDDRRRLIGQDEDLLRSGSITETYFFDNNLIGGAQLEVGENSRQTWLAELQKIKSNLPRELQNLPLGILKVVREHEGDIPRVVMETADGRQHPVIDIPNLAIQILEWTWQGDGEDQKVKDRIISDLLTAWKLEGMRNLVSISKDVYNRLVITLPFEPAGRTVTFGEMPVSYSWGPARGIYPVLSLPSIMSNPLIDPRSQSLVIRIDSQHGSLYCLVPQGEHSTSALAFLKSRDVDDLTFNLEFIGPSSGLSDTSTGQTTNLVGYASLSIPRSEKVIVQGQEIATARRIPCLPIFVPR